MKKSMPVVDVHASECPFCHRTQRVIYDGIHKIYDLCVCRTMRDFQDKRHQLSEYENRLLVIDCQLKQGKEHARQILRDSGIGKRFLETGFETFEQEYMPHAYETALRFAESFDKNQGRGLIFTGDVGTGKTHLAAAIANYIVEEYSVTVEFVSYVELLADIRAAFSDEAKDVAKIEEKLCGAPVLIIDDLGKEKQSEFTNELLFRVVNRRYKDNLPMIVTTNYRLPELAKRLDYAVFSRIVELCKAVDMRGRDYRMNDFRD